MFSSQLTARVIGTLTGDAINPAIPESNPSCFAGYDRPLKLSSSTLLSATFLGGATYDWHLVEGPGQVTLTSPTHAKTEARFSAVGDYVMEVTASKGDLSSSDRAVIRVADNYPSVTITTDFTTFYVGLRNSITFKITRTGTNECKSRWR